VGQFEEKAIISGLGLSEVGRRLGREPLDLTLEACLRAIEDAGLTTADIDGLASYPGAAYPIQYGGPLLPEVQDGLRLELNWYRSSSEGPGQPQAVHNAIMAVAAGVCDHVLVYKTTTETTPPRTLPGRVDITRFSGAAPWALPFGATSAANWSAIIANRHFHEFGTTREQLGMIPVTQRANARLNPNAIYRDPLTLEEYMEARMISTPLTLFDCDAPCDGSVALVVSRSEHAPDCPSGAIRIAALGSALKGRPSWDQWADMTTMSATDSAAHMWSRTDLKPDDVDTAHLYDGFTILTLLWIEALGFCEQGEGGPFIEGGERIALDGRLPLNSDGGQTSAGRLHGFGFVREACVQLRGAGGDRQVPGDPEVAVVGIGAGPTAGCLLLTKDR
jgi:acetyl-CoA acetyltransferase